MVDNKRKNVFGVDMCLCGREKWRNEEQTEGREGDEQR
jgi:hypothetical protein